MTTDAPGSHEGIAAADRMTDALGDFATELKKLARRDRRVRLILKILAATFLVDICLTIGLTILSVETDGNSNAIHQSQIVGCQVNNVRLAKQEQALDAILTPTAASPSALQETAAQRAAEAKYLAAARAEVSAAWSPRNCQDAYKLP